MRRITVIVSSVLSGALVGAVLMLSVQGVSSDIPASEDTTLPGATGVPAGSGATTGQVTSSSTTPSVALERSPTSDQVLLVWTPGGLPDGFAGRVEALPGVTAVTSVQSDLVHMIQSHNASGEVVDQPETGYLIPMEVMAFDPATYLAFLPKQVSFDFTELSPGEIILGSTSAQLRRLGPGGMVIFEDGSRFTVAAVVDDVLIGAAEAAVPIGKADLLGVTVDRYLLVRYDRSRKDLESLIRAALPDGTPVRIRAPGETPVLRHGDAVLPQVLIKANFGEFAYRPERSLTFEIEPEWVEANIVTSVVPLLGPVTCHRNLIPALAGAMGELVELNLSFLVDPTGFAGCFNPRFIKGQKGISRHAWGAAVDINMGSNPQGLESTQDGRLVDIMERWGFTSGHEWLIPDPGHFEYLQPAQHS
jgi:hypothetical protein